MKSRFMSVYLPMTWNMSSPPCWRIFNLMLSASRSAWYSGMKLDMDAPLGTRHTDLRPRVKEITDIIRQNSNARIVLGGPGFNYYARDWLEYLDLDYGIRGEGEESFPQYLSRLS